MNSRSMSADMDITQVIENNKGATVALFLIAAICVSMLLSTISNRPPKSNVRKESQDANDPY